jgi:hypothetical protein
VYWRDGEITPIITRGPRYWKFYRTTTSGAIERTGFAISRFWNRDPYWFQSLDKDLQSRLYVDFMMSKETPQESKRKKVEAQKQKIKRWRSNE